jgi:hypothetical protein
LVPDMILGFDIGFVGSVISIVRSVSGSGMPCARALSIAASCASWPATPTASIRPAVMVRKFYTHSDKSHYVSLLDNTRLTCDTAPHVEVATLSSSRRTSEAQHFCSGDINASALSASRRGP